MGCGEMQVCMTGLEIPGSQQEVHDAQDLGLWWWGWAAKVLARSTEQLASRLREELGPKVPRLQACGGVPAPVAAAAAAAGRNHCDLGWRGKEEAGGLRCFLQGIPCRWQASGICQSEAAGALDFLNVYQ